MINSTKHDIDINIERNFSFGIQKNAENVDRFLEELGNRLTPSCNVPGSSSKDGRRALAHSSKERLFTRLHSHTRRVFQKSLQTSLGNGARKEKRESYK